MKFIAHHRSDILAAIKRNKWQESDFDFIKKRGRIYTRHLQTNQEFSYLRKKETKLDPHTRGWVDHQWFKVKTSNSREYSVENWEKVMQSFEEWLISL